MSDMFNSRFAGAALRRLGAAALALTVLAALPARAEFPDRRLRVVVPYPPGGTTDLLARSITPRLAERLHQTVMIDNRTGAGGVIGSQLVAKSPADGYMLVFGTIASHGHLPVLQMPTSYNAVKDFAPVTLVALTANVLNAKFDAPLNSVAELLAKARAQPGAVNFGSTSLGARRT
jgi:tripartite-type tricarboxylate transporter receptor subunit TctC